MIEQNYKRNEYYSEIMNLELDVITGDFNLVLFKGRIDPFFFVLGAFLL